MTLKVFQDVPCPACSCLCDDLSVKVDGRRLVSVEGACAAGRQMFAAIDAAQPAAAQIDGKPVALERANAEAAAILRESRAPLVCGLAGASLDGLRAATALAERLRGTLDAGDAALANVARAIQHGGISTCTLGEVRDRADVVFFWQADPATSHPRLIERFVKAGRPAMTVVIDRQKTATARQADVFIDLAAGEDLALIAALRAALRGEPFDTASSVNRSLAETAAGLIDSLLAARYAVIFFGAESASGSAGFATVEALLRLVAELNDKVRAAAIYLGAGGHVGAENVVAWQTGYAPPVSFARGFPRYGPAEYSAEALLTRGEVDACLTVGSTSLESLSAAAKSALAKLPLIAIDPPHIAPNIPARVRFVAAVPGVHQASVAWRLDEIPLPLRQLVESDYPTDAAILSQLGELLVD